MGFDRDATKGKKVSALGFCIDAVVGILTITPAAGFITILTSIFIGTIASIVSNYQAHWGSSRSRLDDKLDVFPCHGVGGMVGMVMTGIFASKAINSSVTDQGLFFGETTLFLNHLFALVAVSIFAFVGSSLLLKITDTILPLRVSEEDEKLGLDRSQHDEFLVSN
jgi:Amt family ammonium transporter